MTADKGGNVHFQTSRLQGSAQKLPAAAGWALLVAVTPHPHCGCRGWWAAPVQA